MNPLLISGFGDSITVNRACLTVSTKDSTYEFNPHQIPYDSIIIDGYYGSISFEAMRWLSKHDIPITLLNWNGNLLDSAMPKETTNAKLKIKQYETYLNPKKRIYLANQIVRQKVSCSIGLLNSLSNFYNIDMVGIRKELLTQSLKAETEHEAETVREITKQKIRKILRMKA